MASFTYGQLAEQVTSTATAASTTTLTNSSTSVQVFTGTTTQTIILPNATTFVLDGVKFDIYNQSTASIIVEANGGAVLATIVPGASYIFKLINNGTSAGTWTQLPSGTNTSYVPLGSKNYLSPYTASTSSGVPNAGNGNFEFGSTYGWSLGTTGTLTNGLPTGSPTFGSGASGNLSISTVSSGQLSGSYSLSYVSSAATTAGNMLASNAFFIDAEDQAKVLTWKFYYTPHSGGTTANFSGTSSNSFGVAIWDVTNSAWLQTTAAFGMTQSSGVGYATGTVQTAVTTTECRLVLYNVNATSGAITLYLDDFSLGPQTAPLGPAMTDWVAYTPTILGFGTPTNVKFYSRRVGDTLEAFGNFTSGTVSGTTASIALGFGGGNGNVSTDTTKVGTTKQILGKMGVDTSSTTLFDWDVIVNNTTPTTVNLGVQSSTTSGITAASGTTITGTGATISIFFSVPIVGWSSNVQMSSDTDTRVVAMQVNQATPTATVTNTPSLLKFTATPSQDTHGAYSTSTGLYTVPVTGFYRVAGGITVNATFGDTNQVLLTMSKNGSTTNLPQWTQTTGAAEVNVSTNGAATIFCNTGDTIALFVSSSGTTATIQSNANANFFNIDRISGPSVIAATESVNMRYHASSSTPGTPGAPNAITFTTKDFDSHNAYSGSTYTVPVSGKYQVNANILQGATTTTAGEVVATFIFHNGASYSQCNSFFAGAASTESAPLSDIVNCLAGDTIQIFAGNAGTTPNISAGNAANFISISRVGN